MTINRRSPRAVALKPTKLFLLTRSQIREGDERLKTRLAELKLNFDRISFIEPGEWLAFREKHLQQLVAP